MGRSAQSEPLWEEEVELLPHRGKRSNERSSASLRYAAWERTRKPVRLLSKTADVDEAYAFESGTLRQATQHGHNLALQLRSWERDPRGQLCSFRLGIALPTADRGIWFPTASTAWTNSAATSIKRALMVVLFLRRFIDSLFHLARYCARIR